MKSFQKKSELQSAKKSLKSRSKSVKSRISWNPNSNAKMKSGSKKNFIQANILAVGRGRSLPKKSGGKNSNVSSLKSLLKKGSKTNLGVRSRSNFKTPSLGSC